VGETIGVRYRKFRQGQENGEVRRPRGKNFSHFTKSVHLKGGEFHAGDLAARIDEIFYGKSERNWGDSFTWEKEG